MKRKTQCETGWKLYALGLLILANMNLLNALTKYLFCFTDGQSLGFI